MTTKTIVMIALRLFVIYIFFEILSSWGIALFEIFRPDDNSGYSIRLQLAHTSLFIIAVILLYIYSGNIADHISRIAPSEIVQTHLQSSELLAILIMMVSIFTIISAIPRVVNQLFGIITSLQSYIEQSRPMKERINLFLVGVFATSFQIVVAIILICKANVIARFLLKINQKAA